MPLKLQQRDQALTKVKNDSINNKPTSVECLGAGAVCVELSSSKA